MRMPTFELNPPRLGFIVATRAALAFGVGLLASERIPAARRRRIGLALIALGAATTIPAILTLRRNRRLRDPRPRTRFEQP